ncbi:hypothetical protein [Pseudomonas sp. T1.Ur]|uniref:hypothetical protein n=1 Tax=Pseudomonas sp. T1.Ur TaxID=2928704 RepID=UPI00201DF9C0|nr:hypothetical protein [Pseudomonas sp. T1.Ur]MCL6705031.1 hypothetical protein [Pseudomonas sp. T1.Ur]
MRYLQVTAQDRLRNGKADTVFLHFSQAVEPGVRPTLSNTAFALDIDGDGKVDYKMGDVTNNGQENTVDERLLESFANHYLLLNWFNRGAVWRRYLRVFCKDFYADGTPDTVRLELHEGGAVTSERSLVSWHAAYDFDNDGKLEWNIHHDVNQDGVIDRVDDRLVQRLADTFLQFNWK